MPSVTLAVDKYSVEHFFRSDSSEKISSLTLTSRDPFHGWISTIKWLFGSAYNEAYGYISLNAGYQGFTVVLVQPLEDFDAALDVLRNEAPATVRVTHREELPPPGQGSTKTLTASIFTGPEPVGEGPIDPDSIAGSPIQ